MHNIAVTALGLTAAVLICLPVQSAQAQSGNRPSWFASPKASVPHSATTRTRAAPPTSNGGFFNFLFGAPKRDLYRRPGSQDYNSNRDQYYSPSFNAGPHGYGRYRTMCVRLCDGYYFPISSATSRSGFSRDAERCESSCTSPARLFFHSASGGSPDNMIDLQGKPYSSIENAFLYRTKYLADCRCKPDPWSEEAKEEYVRRAEEGLQKVAGTAEDPATVAPQPEAQPRPVQVRARPQRQPQRSGWKSFLPFGRWSSGG